MSLRIDRKKIIFFIPLLIILLAAFLRLYRIQDFYMFLADQGRDALIVRDIAVLKKFPAIGPTSSIGEVFLGPFYYYLVAPFLLLFGMDPVGLAVAVAVISIILLAVSYKAVLLESSRLTAVLFLLIATFSFRLIEMARFSWNPNPLPYFSFLTAFALTVLLRAKTARIKTIAAITFGALFGMSFQLHHLAALWGPPLLLLGLFFLVRGRVAFISGIYAVSGFLFISLPLIIFDLRHGFINTRNLVLALTKQDVVSTGPYFKQLAETVHLFINSMFSVELPLWIGVLFFTLTIVYSLYLSVKKRNLFAFILAVLSVSYILLFAKISSPRHPHYFAQIYLTYTFLLAYIVGSIPSKRFAITIGTGVVVVFVLLQIPQYYFITGESSRQYAVPKKVGAFIARQAKGKPMNLATYPIQFTSEDCFRYFIEYYGGKVLDRRNNEVGDQMFVLCDREPCKVLNSQSWNIEMFGPAKIDTMWSVDGIRVVRLVH